MIEQHGNKHPSVDSLSLVIDTSYGLTVGLSTGEVCVERDSQRHVELLQPTISKLMKTAGKTVSDIDSIVVGVGPAPFTGLRTGIVAAKALAYATGAHLVGQDILSAQAVWSYKQLSERPWNEEASTSTVHNVILTVNDARRRQLYFALYDSPVSSAQGIGTELISMDIDYPERIVERVNEVCCHIADHNPSRTVTVSVTGRGVNKYAESWNGIQFQGHIQEDSLFDHGSAGINSFIQTASLSNSKQTKPVEPLYLRRPDVSVPNPLKHVIKS